MNHQITVTVTRRMPFESKAGLRRWKAVKSGMTLQKTVTKNAGN